MYNSHGPRPSSVSGSNYAAKAGSSSLLCLASSLPGSHSQKTGPFQFFGLGYPINDNKGEPDGGEAGPGEPAGGEAGEEGPGDRGILDPTWKTQLRQQLSVQITAVSVSECFKALAGICYLTFVLRPTFTFAMVTHHC